MNALCEGLRKGAFLLTEFEGKVNCMTIGWGMEGILWGKHVFTVFVRPSRYTLDLIENALSFAVCVPFDGEMKKEISYFGTVSGRDEDKIKISGVSISDAGKIKGKTIDGCELYYECNVICKQQLNKNNFIDKDIPSKAYPDDDYHFVFYGEIVETYHVDR